MQIEDGSQAIKIGDVIEVLESDAEYFYLGLSNAGFIFSNEPTDSHTVIITILGELDERSISYRKYTS